MSVIIPAKNEAENVAWVLERIPSYVDEVVLIDGHSTDGTVARARSVRPDLVVITETRPGKGAALQAGFATATGNLVVMIDADGSMDPVEIDRFVALLSNGYDFVKGSRFITGGGSLDITPFRRMGNGGLRFLVNLFYGVPFTDLCYGFVAFRREHLESLGLSADGFEIETQLNIRAITGGLRICEVPSLELPRRHGVSNLRPVRDGMRVLRTLLREALSPTGVGSGAARPPAEPAAA